MAGETENGRPVWVRPPLSGREHYSQIGRTKLYEWHKAKKIRSVRITEPGKLKGTRLYHLQSILDHIEKCEAEQSEEREGVPE